MAELDFHAAPIEEIRRAYFAEGCVLLRGCIDPEHLTALAVVLDPLFEEAVVPHLRNRDLRERNLPACDEYLLRDKHRQLLRAITARWYRASEDTNTRRID